MIKQTLRSLSVAMSAMLPISQTLRTSCLHRLST